MSDTPKRRWFQFHLATAILLMFALGFDLLLWVRSTEQVEFYASDGVKEYAREYASDFGFPINVYRHSRFHWTDASTVAIVFVNLPFNAGPLFVLAMASEFILRRREASQR